MKPSVSPHMVAFALLSVMAPLHAQNFAESLAAANAHRAEVMADGSSGSSEKRFSETSALPNRYEVPAVEKTEGNLSEAKPVFASQDATLGLQASIAKNVDSVVDLDVLRNPSPYSKVLVSTAAQPDEIADKEMQARLAVISATYRELGKSEKSADCPNVALSVEQRIKMDTAKVLEVVESEVGANNACACEIVKTAIKTSEAEVDQVVAIVEAAINAAPEQMRIVSQCAIATMPESITKVQALLAKLDPNSGDAGVYSAKSSKDSKDAKDSKVAAVAEVPVLPNPLDLPPAYPPIMPPPIIPPPVTNVNPCTGNYY